MGIDRITLKQHAKEVIRTSVPSALLVTLLYLAITNGISFWLQDPMSDASALIMQGYPADVALHYVFTRPGAMLNSFLSILITLFTWVVVFGYTQYAMRLNRGETAGFSDLLSTFHLAGKIILLQLLTVLFVFLWSLLFVIPGIIAAYRYSQANYILLDHPELSPLECIRRSKEMMDGHKLDRFVLDWSFFGWYLLFSIPGTVLTALLPLGAGYDLLATVVLILCNIWITPYVECTCVGFYDAIRGEDEDHQQTSSHSGWDPAGWNSEDKTDPWN